jgi:hypothetical protein
MHPLRGGGRADQGVFFMSRNRLMLATGAASLAVAAIGVAPAGADPASPEHGCHGFYTTQFKELTGDRGAQGTAIGGRGNSDGDPTNGQAHSEAGRGATLQEFLAAFCGK